MSSLTCLPDPPGIRELRRLVAECGASLSISHPARYHWRITGGVHDVNWYPETPRQIMYVNGATGGRAATARDVLDAALGIATASVSRAPGRRTSSAGRIKRSLYKSDPHCYWCRARVWLGELCDPDIVATLDHKIPVSKGGSSRRDNCVLACLKCNRDRGNSLAPPPPSSR